MSNRATAAISTATLAAAKDAGYLEQPLIVDPNKVQRAKTNYMNKVQKECSQELQENKMQGILFDGRKDQTKFLKRGKDDQLHSSEVKEEHYSICLQPGDEYLCHLTIDPDSRQNITVAEHLAHELFTWIEEKDLVDALQAIGGSTNINQYEHWL